MPDGYDPDDIPGDTIEEAVGSDDNFTVRESGEFGDAAAGFRELFEPTQDFFRVRPESPGGLRPVLADVVDGCQELGAGSGREPDFQACG